MGAPLLMCFKNADVGWNYVSEHGTMLYKMAPRVSYLDFLEAWSREILNQTLASDWRPIGVVKTAWKEFGSHPRPLVSITCRQLVPFHGHNTGSNPVGGAKLDSDR
jgi:hypothetical protein